MRWVAVANPAAGRPGRAIALADDLVRLGLVERVVVGEQLGDSTRLTAAAREFDGVVAVGGDGTIAAVLAGLDRPRQVLALLPAGHGNCLAGDLRLGSIAGAVRALQAGRIASIDLLRTRVQRPAGGEDEFWAASTLAVGYVAQVVATGRGALARLGPSSYAVASLLARPRPHQLTLAVPDLAGMPSAPTGVVINNTAHLANFRAFRRARLDDGRLDIMVLACGWTRQVLHNAAVLCGTTMFGPALLEQAARAVIVLGAPGIVIVDGELIHDIRRIEVECVSAALRSIVGQA